MDLNKKAFRVGESLSGPIFTPFVNWIGKKSRELGIDRVLFLARDGQLFHKISENSPYYESIPAYYFYAGSRASWYTTTPFLVRAKVLEFRIATEFNTIRNTLKGLGIRPEDYPVQFPYSLDEHLSPKAQKEVAVKMTRSQGRRILRESSAPSRDRFIEYLRQHDVEDGEKLAVVDVGWNGNFQNAFESIVQPLGIQVHGFYLGLNHHVGGSNRYWFHYGPSRFPDWMRFYPCLIETLTPADHGSVKGLIKSGGQVVPEISGPPLADPELILNLHEGALSYANAHSETIDPVDIRKLVERPTDEAIDVLSAFYFQKPFSSSEVESFVQKHSFMKALKLSFSFKRNLATWHWPQANLNVSNLSYLGTGLIGRLQLGFYLSGFKNKLRAILGKGFAFLGVLFRPPRKYAFYDLVTFDIFDTLVYRDCGNFLEIFESIESKTKIANFARKRKDAEINLIRLRAWETNLDEIYGELEKMDGSVDWTLIKNLELETESKSLRPSKRGLHHLARARKAGSKVMFITDMYLPSSWLITQLKSHNIWQDGDEIYVSGEKGVNKRSGELYDLVREEHPSTNWLHLGDNLVSDVLNAQKAGVKAKWLPNSYLEAVHSHGMRVLSRFINLKS